MEISDPYEIPTFMRTKRPNHDSMVWRTREQQEALLRMHKRVVLSRSTQLRAETVKNSVKRATENIIPIK